MGEYYPCPSINGERDCPHYYRKQGCGLDRHHLYWPSAEYRNTLEKKWRNLGKNVVEVCRRLHDEIHATETPPEKPAREDMVYDVLEAVAVGEIHMSTNLQRAMKGVHVDAD